MALQLSNAGGADLLVKHAKPPCPPVPVAAPAGPSKTKHDRAATIHKLDKAWDLGGVGGESSAAGARRGGLAESVDLGRTGSGMKMM